MADEHRKRTVQAIKRDLTAEYVCSILDYDPETGEFRWKVNQGKNHTIGKIAGGLTKAGYRLISIGGQRYYAHRMAWLIITGQNPSDEIDHINLNPDDNRLENLRPATHAQNHRNRTKQRNNTSGFKGVSKDKNKWCAQIKLNGRKIFIGTFPTKEEAASAYDAEASRIFGQYARHNKSE
jgi:hypothetical protein